MKKAPNTRRANHASMQELGTEQLQATTGGDVKLVEGLLRDAGLDNVADWWKDLHSPAKNSHPSAK